MKHLTRRASKILGMMIQGQHNIVNNSTYMPVHVEVIGKVEGLSGLGRLISVAHYFEQNGDMMKDPEMVFIESEDLHGNTTYYPMSYELSSMGIYWVSITIEDGKLKSYRPAMQRDSAVFANQWMQNIEMQQFTRCVVR